ncbi:MAG: PmoA family protein [Gemmataceae bacterium]
MPAPRCTLLPLPDHQVSFQADGRERLRWHSGPQYPRPFFYPLAGPASGLSLTRMGHPGAPDHDHHRSVWFAHENVSGVNFWTDKTAARVRQTEWLAYQDGEAECVMAVRLAWSDGHDPKPLLTQELFAAVAPGPDGETLVELQTTFRPATGGLEFGKTNFGFLAVRVAKAISGTFGGGRLTSSTGTTGEAAIFGRQAAWVDYSGEQPGGAEGVTYFDHPANPGHPTHWHVREDGWMGASACFAGRRPVRPDDPLTLRYLLHAHRGPVDPRRAAELLAGFGRRPRFELVKAPARSVAWGVRRAAG